MEAIYVLMIFPIAMAIGSAIGSAVTDIQNKFRPVWGWLELIIYLVATVCLVAYLNYFLRLV